MTTNAKSKPKSEIPRAKLIATRVAARDKLIAAKIDSRLTIGLDGVLALSVDADTEAAARSLVERALPGATVRAVEHDEEQKVARIRFVIASKVLAAWSQTA